MTDHTPEPWALRTEQGVHKIVGPHHPAIGAPPVAFNCVYGRGVGHQDAIDECAANAARIVACVNACAGIPTERLGDVKALVEALEFYSHPDIIIGHIIDGKIIAQGDRGDKARAALAPFRKD